MSGVRRRSAGCRAARTATRCTLRWGVPELPASGRRRFVVSPFGADRFLAPPATNFVRVELPESGAANLRVGYALANDPFFRVAKVSAEITKKSRPWVAQVDVPEVTAEDRSAEAPGNGGAMATDASGNERGTDESATSEESTDENGDATEATDESSDEASSENDQSGDQSGEQSNSQQPADNSPVSRWIEVSGTPGQAYVLQHFEFRNVYAFQRSGSYWLSTVQTGSATDEADATGVVVSPRVVDGRVRDELVATAAIPLDVEHAYTRRFNLLDDVTVFLQVTQAGSYQASAQSAGKSMAVRFVLEPFFTTAPRD